MNQILYGVGTMILKDFENPSKVLMMGKLQNVAVTVASNNQDIFGGDSSFPIASFPISKEITMSAKNAEFNLAFVDAAQGSDVATGAVTFTEPVEVEIPADGVLTLNHVPVANSLAIQTEGFSVVTVAPTAAGKVFLDDANQQIVFHTNDVGLTVNLVYDWLSNTSTVTSTITEESMKKPFVVIHRLPIFEDGVKTHEMQITIHKAQVINGFQFNLERKKAFTPNLQLKALDAGRDDEQLWSVSITPVA